MLRSGRTCAVQFLWHARNGSYLFLRSVPSQSVTLHRLLPNSLYEYSLYSAYTVYTVGAAA